MQQEGGFTCWNREFYQQTGRYGVKTLWFCNMNWWMNIDLRLRDENQKCTSVLIPGQMNNWIGDITSKTSGKWRTRYLSGARQEKSPRGSQICGLFSGFNAISFLGYLILTPQICAQAGTCQFGFLETWGILMKCNFNGINDLFGGLEHFFSIYWQ